VLKLLQEVLREPGFPENEFDILKREAVDGVEKAKTEPQMLAVQALRRKLNSYPKTDIRYVPTIDEAAASLKACTLDQVKQLYADLMGSGTGELAIVGDFDPEPTLKVLDEALKGWKAKVPYTRIDRPAKPVAEGSIEKINTPDKANAVYLAGLVFPMTDADPEYAPLVIGNYILGAAPLASKLSNRVRGKDGLSYGVGSQVNASPIDEAGQFMVFAITNPKNMEKVEAAIAEEIAKFLKDGVSATELEEAKKAYLATQKGSRANDATLAAQLSGALFAKRTFQYYADLEKKIESLQPADIKMAMDKRVEPKKLVIVEAGDFSAKPKPEEKK
jgi:zinc protease